MHLPGQLCHVTVHLEHKRWKTERTLVASSKHALVTAIQSVKLKEGISDVLQ